MIHQFVEVEKTKDGNDFIDLIYRKVDIKEDQRRLKWQIYIKKLGRPYIKPYAWFHSTNETKSFINWRLYYDTYKMLKWYSHFTSEKIYDLWIYVNQCKRLKDEIGRIYRQRRPRSWCVEINNIKMSNKIIDRSSPEGRNK